MVGNTIEDLQQVQRRRILTVNNTSHFIPLLLEIYAAKKPKYYLIITDEKQRTKEIQLWKEV